MPSRARRERHDESGRQSTCDCGAAQRRPVAGRTALRHFLLSGMPHTPGRSIVSCRGQRSRGARAASLDKADFAAGALAPSRNVGQGDEATAWLGQRYKTSRNGRGLSRCDSSMRHQLRLPGMEVDEALFLGLCLRDPRKNERLAPALAHPIKRRPEATAGATGDVTAGTFELRKESPSLRGNSAGGGGAPWFIRQQRTRFRDRYKCPVPPSRCQRAKQNNHAAQDRGGCRSLGLNFIHTCSAPLITRKPVKATILQSNHS